MALVCVSANAILFLAAWEVMALAGFLLLTVWKLAPWIVVVLLGTIGAILQLI